MTAAPIALLQQLVVEHPEARWFRFLDLGEGCQVQVIDQMGNVVGSGLVLEAMPVAGA